MPNFEYIASDQNGASQQGNIIGIDLPAALTDLGKRGLTVEKIQLAQSVNDPLNVQHPSTVSTRPAAVQDQRTWVQNSSERQVDIDSELNTIAGPLETDANPHEPKRSYMSTNVVGPVAGRASLVSLAFFFRQLGTMLQAGVPYVQCLDTLSTQSKDFRLRPVILECRQQVENGRPISAALQRYPESINAVVISLVRAGEEGGFLDKAILQVADYIDREIELRNLYRRLTFYPKLVFALTFIVIALANTIISMVAPGVNGLQSPFLFSTWVILISIGIGYWLFLRIGLSNFRIKRVYDQIVLKTPVIGKTMHQLAMARFGRAFGALYEGGVPISKAMKLSADACGNEELRARMYPYFDLMEKGGGVHETFRRTGAFSPIVLDMVGTGERTGNLDQMLTKVASYYEDEANTRQTILATAVGVVMLVLVAIYIGYIVIHFYSSYFSGIFSAAGS